MSRAILSAVGRAFGCASGARGAWAWLALLAAALPASAQEADALVAFRKAFGGNTPASEMARAARGLAEADSRAAAEVVCGGYASTAAILEGLALRRAEVRAEMAELAGDPDGAGRSFTAEQQSRLRSLRIEEEKLRDRDDEEREVLGVLRRTMGRFRDPKAVDHIASLPGRSSTSPPLRVAALEALGEIGAEASLRAVRAALKDRDPAVREAALGALARIRAKEEETLRVLGAALSDDRWTVRLAAARRIAGIGSPEAVDLLVPRLALEDGKPRADIADLLRSLTGQRFGPEPEGWTHWWRENRESYVTGDRVLTPGAPVPKREEGPGAGADYYGITVESRRILFVIDISGSMDKESGGEGGTVKVDDAKKELLRCIRTLEAESAFTVFAFNDVVSKWKPALVKADAAAKEGIAKWVEALGAANWTNTHAALEEALTASAANPRNNMGADYGMAADTIFLLTDGSPTTGEGKTQDGKGNPEYLRVLEAVRVWNREKRVSIHAIGIGEAINADFLSTLARENDGTFVHVK